MEVVILQATGTSVISPKLDVPVDEMADDDRAQMSSATAAVEASVPRM